MVVMMVMVVMIIGTAIARHDHHLRLIISRIECVVMVMMVVVMLRMAMVCAARIRRDGEGGQQAGHQQELDEFHRFLSSGVKSDRGGIMPFPAGSRAPVDAS